MQSQFKTGISGRAVRVTGRGLGCRYNLHSFTPVARLTFLLPMTLKILHTESSTGWGGQEHRTFKEMVS
ncbi:MAG: hypothetical protein DVB25_05005, partial [Verrucomicrobia bacterium]